MMIFSLNLLLLYVALLQVLVHADDIRNPKLDLVLVVQEESVQEKEQPTTTIRNGALRKRTDHKSRLFTELMKVPTRELKNKKSQKNSSAKSSDTKKNSSSARQSSKTKKSSAKRSKTKKSSTSISRKKNKSSAKSSKKSWSPTDSPSSSSTTTTVNEWTVTITNPSQHDVTVVERLIDIEGKVTPNAPPGFLVEAIVGFDVFTTTNLPDGSFRFRNIYLPEQGENTITISVTGDDGFIIGGTTTLHVSYNRQSEGSSFISIQDGGSIEITDQDSPIVGAKIDVPPGLAKRDFLGHVIYDPDHVPLVPFEYIAVGNPVLFAPETELFNGLVSLIIPFVPALIPDPLNSTNVRILRLKDDGWEEHANDPTIFDENLLTFDVDAFDSKAFISVVEVPLASDQVIIETKPAAAMLYIDGVAYGTSPAVLNGIQQGEHTARIYLRGYNELFLTFNVSSMQRTVLKNVLEYTAEPYPYVQLEGYLDGLKTSSSFVEIIAHVSFEGEDLDQGVGIISINGKDSIQAINDGTIRGFVGLDTGHNHVEVRVNGPNGNTGVSPPAIITRETAQNSSRSRILLSHDAINRHDRALNSTEIKITLTWDTVNTDIDLHVFDPEGNHASFQNFFGIPNANLDVDDTDGYGPEIFSCISPVPGTYRVAVDSYDIDFIQTTASLEVSVGGNIIFTGSYTFTEDDHNASDGDPEEANPNAFWDAFTFEVGSLAIISVETQQGSDSFFTTLEGENKILISSSAPEYIDDSDIFYDIEEVVEGFKIISPSTFGRKTSFTVQHYPMTSLTEPSSHALKFKIVAYTMINGERQESAPVFIQQDWHSQIRQEYLDKRDYDPSFIRPTPPRNQIISRAEFIRYSPYFTFEELSQYSDYYNIAGLSVIGHAAAIANKLRTAWGYPLYCTSGWRNPRRNDRLKGSAINSFHQIGDAVDLQPSWESEKWPSNVPGCGAVQDFETAQKALLCLAEKIFDTTMYYVDFHNNHLHIHMHTSGDANGSESDGIELSSVLRLDIGTLTILGEGIIPHVYWPETSSSGVSLGIGYDIGSRSADEVKDDLIAAGMDDDQAAIISEGSGLKGANAKQWVLLNSARVGTIDETVIRRLFLALLPQYTQQAKALAIDTNPSPPGGEQLNARSREIIEGKQLYTYVMTEEQWDSLHPAMHELITDLKYHGGFYAYDRIARINEILIKNGGNHLEQFKEVAKLFSDPEKDSGYSYMDEYAIAIGLTPGNQEIFYDVDEEALGSCTERRQRIRLSFVLNIISAFERGANVVMKLPQELSDSNECIVENPHEPDTCAPGPDGCYTPRASFVRNAIMACFPDSQLPPTTYETHSEYGNSLDAWPKGGGLGLKVTGHLKVVMDDLALWLMENHADLKIYYIMFYNRIWNPSRDEFGLWWDCDKPRPGTDPPEYRCLCMVEGTCNDVTYGHYDHLHISVLYK